MDMLRSPAISSRVLSRLQEPGGIFVGYRIWMAYLAKFVYQESKTFLVHISNNAQSVGLVYLQLRRDKTARGRASAAFSK
jgi:hypothetical protein